MTVVSASEVSRNFSAMVDRAGKGERIEIIRNGRLVAALVPIADTGNGKAVKDRLKPLTYPGDEDWYEDIAATRALLTEGGDPWDE
ncbi:type II toxin-antitoxin system Phd/YefM family antitoxin [Streptomyces polyrhachis]|uniref:Antitoxin n=1 Tax=Streptomyces polyrhachis TaxID=1282885 RepID=A0ABW2G8X4_9ACTN